MTFDPNIPTNDQTIKSAQPQIRTNFQAQNAVYGSDHYAFDEANANLSGKHSKVTLPNQSPPPSTIAGELALYSKDVSGSSGLFYRRDADPTEYQITSGSGGGEWQLVSSINASNVPHVDFINLLPGYDYKVVLGSVFAGSTAGTQALLARYSTDNGINFNTGPLNYRVQGYRSSGGTLEVFNVGANGLRLTRTETNVLSDNYNGEVIFYNPASALAIRLGRISSEFTIGGGVQNITGSAELLVSSLLPINAIRILWATGDIASGRIALYSRELL
jgi:hypothetical protein